MSLAGKKVLVTGGTGFIGSVLVKRLAAAKAEIHLLVRSSSSGERLGELWDDVSRHVGNIDDAASLARCARASRPEFVFHLAKDREGPSFKKEAAATMRLAAVLHHELPGLSRWVRTAHAVRERFGRGADAALCDVIARRYALPTVTLELFSVYGPGQEPGDFPLSVISEAMARRKATEAYGDWKDFIYVEDVARAYALAALRPGVEGGCFQIGSGILMSKAEVARLAFKLMGRDRTAARTPIGPMPEGEHPADIAGARQRLGWIPQTGLEDGLTQMLQWWQCVPSESKFDCWPRSWRCR